MVNRIKTDGKREKKPNAVKTWKSKPLLVQAYIKVAKASKQIQRLQASMSHMIHKEIMEGMSSEESMFHSSRPYFFANNVAMVQSTELKKIEKKMVPFDGNFLHLHYNYRSGIVENELDNETNLFEPDLIGRKMHPKKVNVHPTLDYGTANTELNQTMLNIMAAEIENKHTHRYLSLICGHGTLIKEQVQEYLKHMDVIGGEHGRDADIKLVEASSRHIVSIIGKESDLRHYHKSHDRIKTADHVIHIFNTEHQFICKNDSYGWKIYKKNVFASYINSDKPVHIPVCEELILQYQIQDTSNQKNHPLLINAKSCLVISCAIQSSHPDNSRFASLHFFGDNALSIVLGANILESIIQDRTKLCARLAGMLCKAFLDIHGKTTEQRSESISFFKKLFSEGLYKDQDTDFDRLKQTLKEYSIKNGRYDDDESRLYYEKQEKIQDLEKKYRTNQNILDGMAEEGIARLLSDDASKYTKEKKRLEQDIDRLKRESLKVPGTNLVLKSFIIRQNIRSLIKAENGDICNNRKCVSSQAFSVLALSPQPGRNYVFITTHFHDTNGHKSSNFIPGGSNVKNNASFYSDMEKHNSFTEFNTRQVSLSTQANTLNAEFDLEHELDLIEAY